MAIQSSEAVQTAEDDQPSVATDLYDFPEVYAALRAPDPGLLDGVRALLREHVSGAPAVAHLNGHRNAAHAAIGQVVARATSHGVRHERPARQGGPMSIMDPACGPANWLEPFARERCRVAGNDLSTRMVAGARRALRAIAGAAEAGFEIIEGDMRDLRFRTGPFDAAIEIAGTTGLLPCPADLLAHLTTVGEHLRPGGVFLVTVFFDRRASMADAGLPVLCFQSGALPVMLANGGQGEARVRYALVAWEEEPPAMRMRRTVLTRGVSGCPRRLVDEYSLRTWREDEVLALIARTGLFDVVSMEGLPDPAGADPLGEQTLVLRRR